LTAERAKPAVPFGGRYRIIDFTLSNCLHSGLRRILVLTQYKSHSLDRHVSMTWRMSRSSPSRPMPSSRYQPTPRVANFHSLMKQY